jgi:hypothetical protein
MFSTVALLIFVDDVVKVGVVGSTIMCWKWRDNHDSDNSGGSKLLVVKFHIKSSLVSYACGTSKVIFHHIT